MDRILARFLAAQEEEGKQLSGESDLVEIEPLESAPCRLYLARYRCKGLVMAKGGIEEAELFDVGIHFPLDYWREVRALEVVTLLHPPNVFHPNAKFPWICIGTIYPGTGLVEIVARVFNVLTYRKYGLREDDALNPTACAWARRNRERFPVDRRPLKRGKKEFRIRDTQREEAK